MPCTRLSTRPPTLNYDAALLALRLLRTRDSPLLRLASASARAAFVALPLATRSVVWASTSSAPPAGAVRCSLGRFVDTVGGSLRCSCPIHLLGAHSSFSFSRAVLTKCSNVSKHRSAARTAARARGVAGSRSVPSRTSRGIAGADKGRTGLVPEWRTSSPVAPPVDECL